MGFPQNERLTEGLAFPDLINAYTALTTAQTGGKVNLSKARKVAYVFQAGTLGTAAVVTCKLQGSILGTSTWADIAGSSFTLVKATDDNAPLVIETSAASIGSLGLGYVFVRYSVGATVASDVRVASIAATGPEEPVATILNVTGVKSLNVV